MALDALPEPMLQKKAVPSGPETTLPPAASLRAQPVGAFSG